MLIGAKTCRATTRELPNNTPYVAKLSFIRDFQKKWPTHTRALVETVHKENICHLVFAPLRSRDPSIAARARLVAENAVKTLQGAGVFGVEMFLMADG